MNAQAGIIAGGVYCIGMAVFHLLFWRLFDWRRGLRPLSAVNRGAMQVMNISLIMVFLVFAYLCFAHTDELLGTELGRGVLGAIALFWLLRAVQQWVYFGMAHPASRLLFAVFVLGSVLFGLPVIPGAGGGAS